MASSLEEEKQDLTTCSVCLEEYDVKARKAKFLPCAHTFCLSCLKVVKRKYGNVLPCPICKIESVLPVDAVNRLPNNMYAIFLIKQEQEKKATKRPIAQAKAGNESADQRQQELQHSCTFSANCFSVNRNESDINASFHCKNLQSHAGMIYSLEFSEDGTFMASAGYDTVVRLWPIRQAMNDLKKPIIPFEVKMSHESYGMAIAPDNNRLFTAGNCKIWIHDIETKKELRTVNKETQETIVSISLKPESNGEIFATADGINGYLSLIDTRQVLSIVDFGNEKCNSLWSVMFSPANSFLITVAGTNGTRILDIRTKRCVYTFDPIPTTSSRFNKKGSRLLCRPEADVPTIYNISPEQQERHQTNHRVTNRVLLTATDYSTAKNGRSNVCFAGAEDELVVASSSINNLFVWTVSDTRIDGIIDNPLLILSGHQRPIHQVRYCKSLLTLASADKGGLIKLWTPQTTDR